MSVLSNVTSGLNIQFPISQEILIGKKIIETRTYPMPKKYIRKKIALVETPGAGSKFKSRIIALLVFDESYKYVSLKGFRKDADKHLIEKGDPWDWNKKPKWAWPILSITPYKPKKYLLHRGYVFRRIELIN